MARPSRFYIQSTARGQHQSTMNSLSNINRKIGAALIPMNNHLGKLMKMRAVMTSINKQFKYE